MNMGRVHPDDILVVGYMSEAAAWPEFDKRNVLSAQADLSRQLRGRRFRHAYVTDMAMWNMDSRAVMELDLGRVVSGGEIRNAVDWKPEPEPTRWQRIRKVLLDLCERFG